MLKSPAQLCGHSAQLPTHKDEHPRRRSPFSILLRPCGAASSALAGKRHKTLWLGYCPVSLRNLWPPQSPRAGQPPGLPNIHAVIPHPVDGSTVWKHERSCRTKERTDLCGTGWLYRNPSKVTVCLRFFMEKWCESVWS